MGNNETEVYGSNVIELANQGNVSLRVFWEGQQYSFRITAICTEHYSLVL